MKKTYLLLSALVLTVTGLLFALAPNRYLAGFGPTISDPNLLNILRSVGGFYLGFAIYVFIASRKVFLQTGAILAVTLVMSGLLSGRIFSLLVDGLPAPKLWVSLAVELILAVWGLALALKGENS